MRAPKTKRSSCRKPSAVPCALSDVQIAMNPTGHVAGYQADHYMPAMQDDRPVGAVLAGLPTQLQQNVPRELAITEAAVLAGVDPLRFRMNQTDDERLLRKA